MRQMIADGVKVQTVVTSPPYWGLRDYGVSGQFGLERDPLRYLARMRSVFRLVWDLLADDGTLWLNMGDSYACAPGGWQGKNGQRASRTFTARIANHKRGSGLKPKDLVGMPWLLALTLRNDGWYLRRDIIWHKPNPMPESVTDRPTTSHEYLFLLTKADRYYYDAPAIKEPASPDTHARYARGRSDHHKYADGGPGNQTIAKSFEHMEKKFRPGVNPKAKVPSGWDTGDGSHREAIGRYPRSKQNESFSAAVADIVDSRNKRSVWTIPTQAFSKAHFATFPEDLIAPCILAGAPAGGIVFDPFMGSGTTAKVATDLGRQFIGTEINPAYVAMHESRRTTTGMPL